MAAIYDARYQKDVGYKHTLTVTFVPLHEGAAHTEEELAQALARAEETLREAWELKKLQLRRHPMPNRQPEPPKVPDPYALPPAPPPKAPVTYPTPAKAPAVHTTGSGGSGSSRRGEERKP